jgi:Tol biopolymer transport system component
MKKVSILLMAAAFLSLGWASVSQQSAHDLFQKALNKERAEGDLKGAIALYQQVLDSAKEQSLAAQAQLRIGMCYEKMGVAEAVKAYELVVQKYPDQAEAVAEARSRLGALRKEEPAGLTMNRLLPPEVYLECQALSPDGSKIAGIDFSKGQNVAVYDLAAGKTEFVTNFGWTKEFLWTYVPVWSPDGREIAYQAGHWGSGEESTGRMLWISDLAGKSRKLFENPHGSIVPCDWLPDGRAVVVAFANEDRTVSLGLISVKEGGPREIHRLLRTYSRGGDPAQAAAAGSVDASPNGRFIAFSDGPPDAGRDIYVIPSEGGPKTAITDHPADDNAPRWSPDGRHIVFMSNRHGSWALWGVAVRDGQPDGQPFMILEGMQDSTLANWTKRGLLSTMTAVIHDVYTLDIDPQSHEPRGKPRIVDYTPSGSNYCPIWSPDGKRLAFFSPWKLPSPMYSSDTGDNFVIVIPSKGKGGRKYSIPTQRVGSRWLADGSGLEIIGIGDDQRLFYNRLELETGKWTSHPIPAMGISVEGAAGAARDEGKSCYYFFQLQPIPGLPGSEPGVYALNLETGQRRYILNKKEIESLSWSLLSVSRDNKRLACGWGGEIALIDVGTGHVEKLEYQKERLGFPVWSPDGNHLVAVGRVGGGEEEMPNELFIVSPGDGKLKNLDIARYLPPKGGIWLSPDWSPDGRRITFGTRFWRYETNLIQNLIPNK